MYIWIYITAHVTENKGTFHTKQTTQFLPYTKNDNYSVKDGLCESNNIISFININLAEFERLRNNSSCFVQNGTSLAGRMIPHPVAVSCTHLGVSRYGNDHVL